MSEHSLASAEQRTMDSSWSQNDEGVWSLQKTVVDGSNGFSLPTFQSDEILQTHEDMDWQGCVGKMMALRELKGITVRWNGARLIDLNNEAFNVTLTQRLTREWPQNASLDCILYIPFKICQDALVSLHLHVEDTKTLLLLCAKSDERLQVLDTVLKRAQGKYKLHMKRWKAGGEKGEMPSDRFVPDPTVKDASGNAFEISVHVKLTSVKDLENKATAWQECINTWTEYIENEDDEIDIETWQSPEKVSASEETRIEIREGMDDRHELLREINEKLCHALLDKQDALHLVAWAICHVQVIDGIDESMHNATIKEQLQHLGEVLAPVEIKNNRIHMLKYAMIDSAQQVKFVWQSALFHQAIMIMDPDQVHESTGKRQKDEFITENETEIGPLIKIITDERGRLIDLSVQTSTGTEILVGISPYSITRKERAQPELYFLVWPHGKTLINYKRHENRFIMTSYHSSKMNTSNVEA